MADVAGLVIGAIALASLFSTCIELFDYFELGRSYACDYQLACTKLGLLRARLSQWGDALNVAAPGGEHPVLRDCWPIEGEIVGRSLLGIQSILDNTTLLVEKYNVERKGRSMIKSLTVQARQIIRAGTDSNSRLIRRRTLWAIHDKVKFDALIQDLSFLIENLEKVVNRLRMPSQLQQEVQDFVRREERDPQDLSRSVIDQLLKHTGIPKERSALVIKKDEKKEDRAIEVQSTVNQQDLPWPLTDQLLKHTGMPENTSAFVIQKSQKNEERAIGVQGTVDQKNVAFQITAEQCNKNFSIGVQGMASSEGLVKLAKAQQNSAQEHSQSNGAKSKT